MNPTFEQVAALGFIFPGARMWATIAMLGQANSYPHMLMNLLNG